MLDGFPMPGSRAAVKLGCTCPTKENHNGRGVPYEGRRGYVYSSGCPVHCSGRYLPEEIEDAREPAEFSKTEKAAPPPPTLKGAKLKEEQNSMKNFLDILGSDLYIDRPIAVVAMRGSRLITSILEPGDVVSFRECAGEVDPGC